MKSLALAKLNHLIISLPNPSSNILNRIQTMFFNFIWNNGPDKVKRSILTQNYDKGGLRMIDLHHFVASLKINWLKKYILKESKFLELVKTMCPMITSYYKTKLNEIDNPFWKNAFESYLILNNKYCVSDWEQYKILPIWYNNYFKIGGKSFLFRDFYGKGHCIS